jgi:hypothetical protein
MALVAEQKTLLEGDDLEEAVLTHQGVLVSHEHIKPNTYLVRPFFTEQIYALQGEEDEVKEYAGSSLPPLPIKSLNVAFGPITLSDRYMVVAVRGEGQALYTIHREIMLASEDVSIRAEEIASSMGGSIRNRKGDTKVFSTEIEDIESLAQPGNYARLYLLHMPLLNG